MTNGLYLPTNGIYLSLKDIIEIGLYTNTEPRVHCVFIIFEQAFTISLKKSSE